MAVVGLDGSSGDILRLPSLTLLGWVHLSVWPTAGKIQLADQVAQSGRFQSIQKSGFQSTPFCPLPYGYARFCPLPINLSPFSTLFTFAITRTAISAH